MVYLCRSIPVARANVYRKLEGQPYGPEDLRPGAGPVLVRATVPEDRYLNVVTEAGCRDAGLPPTYPLDSRRRTIPWRRCQPIGLRAWEDGLPGVAAGARRAAARSLPTSDGGSCGAARLARSSSGSGTRRFANNATVSDQRHPGGLSSQEAAKRLRQLGPVEDRTSRSTASIVAGNVFTLFNLIIGVFFVIMLALGLFADALFGFIAVINSYIGIRQEIKAKETLESLALLVAPRAKVVRDCRAGRAAGRGGRPRRLDPGRARRPAGRRRRCDREPGPHRRRVDAHRRGRRGPQARRASGRSPGRSASPARATTRSTPFARTATRRRSPARPARSDTRPPRSRTRSTWC